MNKLYIGENIKRLRLERGITQETLAEYMNVTSPAVSKWERGETYPDISMVIPLASYFGVSTDELLGIDAAKDEEKITEYLSECRRLSAIGKASKALVLITQAYEEFPNDWRIVCEYILNLYNDPCQFGTDMPSGKLHKDKLYRLCSRVLDECTVDSYRFTALSIMKNLFCIDGNLKEAIAIAKRFPHYRDTFGEQLEECYEPGSDEWWKYLRENIGELMNRLQSKIQFAAIYSDVNHREKIKLLQKAVSVIDLVIDKGDYCFYHFDLTGHYLQMAEYHAELGEYHLAAEAYEKSLYHTKEYDRLPMISVYHSFLVSGNRDDKSVLSSDTDDNLTARQLNNIRSSKIYEQLKEMPEMKAIMEKYMPFAGKKKNYSDRQ